MTEIADILDKAADLIEPEGRWTRRAFGRDNGGKPLDLCNLGRATCFCARGAMVAAGDKGCAAQVYFAHNALGKSDGYFALNIIDWNDAPERKQAEVVSAFREAAAKAREQSA